MLLPPPGRNHHTEYNTQGVALGYMIVGLSDRHCTVVYSLIGCYEENDCLRHFPLLKNNMKKPDKNLSGKSDEREVKICKNDFSPFIFHSSFHYFSFNFFPSLRFRSVKGKLSPPQRLCFTAWNMVFRTTKPYLSQIYFFQTVRW